MSSTFTSVTVEQEGDVLWVELNRPDHLNALDHQMATELSAIFPALVEESGARVVVLAGAGGNFMAGADLDLLQSWTELDRDAAIREVGASFQAAALERLDVPVIAAVDGIAFGMGMDLALAGDFLIITSRAALGLPETNVGVNPLGGSTFRLARAVGPGRAARVIMLGERVAAADALGWGLAMEIVEPEELRDAAAKLAGKLANRSAVALRASKRLLRAPFVGDDARLAAELEEFAYCLAGEDVREGIASVRERRRPVFGSIADGPR